MSDLKRMILYLSFPVVVGFGACILYFAAHVGTNAVIIPPGTQRTMIEPLSVSPMVLYWQAKAIQIGLWSFAVTSLLSALTFIIRRNKKLL